MELLYRHHQGRVCSLLGLVDSIVVGFTRPPAFMLPMLGLGLYTRTCRHRVSFLHRWLSEFDRYGMSTIFLSYRRDHADLSNQELQSG